MYAVALVILLINLIVVCRPSTFDPNFHWDSQPDDLTRGLFCEGTPATKTSYWGSLVLTILVYLFGMAVTPFWPLNWWMGELFCLALSLSYLKILDSDFATYWAMMGYKDTICGSLA
eukprot:scaffold298669_cov156-Cyclotella_meneghiniana.AAC.1